MNGNVKAFVLEWLTQVAAALGTTVTASSTPSRDGIGHVPRITKVLAGMHRDTKAQRGTLEEARRTLGLLEQVVGQDMLTAYCAQRADLRGYHRMLKTWSEASPEPEMKAGIGRFLLAVDEIKDDTKAMLGIFAAALAAL